MERGESGERGEREIYFGFREGNTFGEICVS